MPTLFRLSGKKSKGKYGNKKRCCKQQSTYHYLPNRGDIAILFQIFENMM